MVSMSTEVTVTWATAAPARRAMVARENCILTVKVGFVEKQKVSWREEVVVVGGAERALVVG
jgi:hypothetical protein